MQTYGFTRASASTEYGILWVYGLLSALVDLPIMGKSTVYGYWLRRRLIGELRSIVYGARIDRTTYYEVRRAAGQRRDMKLVLAKQAVGTRLLLEEAQRSYQSGYKKISGQAGRKESGTVLAILNSLRLLIFISLVLEIWG